MASNFALKSADYEFVLTVPRKLTCSICTNVLSDPRLTECCGQHFCQKCLQSWLNLRNKSCPHCRTVNFAHILDKSVTREINKLKVRCSHKEEGCEWVGELGALRTHLDSKQGCAYEQVDCPYGCTTPVDAYDEDQWFSFINVRVRRKDLEDHLKNECDQRRYNCKYCGKEGTYKNITKYHYDDCPDFPSDCPNECGVTEIKQKDLPAHQEQCPLEPEQCPFQEAGCETRLVHKDVEEHLTSQSQQHLLLTLRRTQSLEQECSQSKKKNTELEQKCNTLEERCKKLEQVVNEHERRLTSRGSRRVL